jgi:hypothetical protein
MLALLVTLQPGQVGFHSDKMVRKYVVLEKDRETLRRLEKTREERYPDLAAERRTRDEEEKRALKAESRERSKKEKELDEARCAITNCGHGGRGGTANSCAAGKRKRRTGRTTDYLKSRQTAKVMRKAVLVMTMSLPW